VAFRLIIIIRRRSDSGVARQTQSLSYLREKVAIYIGNKSVPIQLAQCLGWPFPMLKYKYIFQIKYMEGILSNSTRKLLWFEITKMLIAVKKINLMCYFRFL